MRDNQERIMDMLEAIERVEKYARQGESAFRSDELIQVYILHHLQVLGEALMLLNRVISAQGKTLCRFLLVGEYHLVQSLTPSGWPLSKSSALS